MKYYISSEIFIDILGVNFLHKQNPQIIHRDLCPDNILIRMGKNDKIYVKIADFGLITIHKYAEQLHKSDVGHIEYIAPEVNCGRSYDTSTVANFSPEHSGTEKDQRGVPFVFEIGNFYFYY